ncbi:restriction endonuclease [Promicromonospora sp. NPDC059942]|uniref:restriction endonuclease n=1 Tax=Promicromonospora sp. NPDC059942 TaxID=3347009 RepID=UPI0036593F02
MTWNPGESIDSWQVAEDAAVWHAAHVLGYSDAKATSTVDGGVDIESSLLIGQTKRLTERVGRPAIQQIVGARGRCSPDVDVVFYSRSGYTKPAERFALDNGVALFAFDSLGNIVAENLPARDIERDGEERIARSKRLAERPADWRMVLVIAFFALSPALALAFHPGDRSVAEWVLGGISIAAFPCLCLSWMGTRALLRRLPEHLHAEAVGYDILALYDLVWPRRDVVLAIRPSRLSARISHYRSEALLDELRQYFK